MNNLNDLIDDDSLDEKAECPIAWCTGDPFGHRAGGDPVEYWEHAGAFRQIGDFDSFAATISESQIGSEPIALTLIVDIEDTFSPDRLRVLAQDLASLSTSLLAEADRIELLTRSSK